MPISSSVAPNNRYMLWAWIGENRSDLEKSGLLLEKRNLIIHLFCNNAYIELLADVAIGISSQDSVGLQLE